jgi:hypothetical protein
MYIGSRVRDWTAHSAGFEIVHFILAEIRSEVDWVQVVGYGVEARDFEDRDFRIGGTELFGFGVEGSFHNWVVQGKVLIHLVNN